YFLPTSYYWWAVYYRPSTFATLDIAAPIRTWAELMDAAQVLRSAGVAPFALGARHQCPAAAWFDYLNMRVNGPAFHQELMALRRPYTGAGVRAASERWSRLPAAGFIPGAPPTNDPDHAVAAALPGA